ncbi:glutathione S-transferase family protein [Pacificoceanicola onchidii]|uniref:glutathione S-transferase family protein n=1 Tax=Pacificoceanicola onchidii TaxID=2562685 RepID=UPI0010A38250|nr:glutathione S-transferase family protein [Pacificoceanicola onchidii]
MGQLVDGKWQVQSLRALSKDGAFTRKASQFRNWITPDGAAGPTGEAGFAAEADRYHLYVSHACPWAHRALIFRSLKGLEPLISVSAVHPDMLDDGWSFETDGAGATGDALYGLPFLRDLYVKADPSATTRVTVPVLWDKTRQTIVSNESAEIIRMFNSAFDHLTGEPSDYYPSDLRSEIDTVNARIYDTLNNGVYKSGFATTQEAYEAAVYPLFETLDWIEARLESKRYLVGPRITEADWRLFTTLIRFDKVYHGHFKCNRKRIVDYPNIWGYLRELYQWPGVSETVNFHHITRHYHFSHESVNPHRIVPIGPDLDLLAPHGRGALEAV